MWRQNDANEQKCAFCQISDKVPFVVQTTFGFRVDTRDIPFVPSMFKSKKISEVAVSEVGANQIVFWLSVRIFYSLSRRFKQRCRTRAKEIKEKNIPLLR